MDHLPGVGSRWRRLGGGEDGQVSGGCGERSARCGEGCRGRRQRSARARALTRTQAGGTTTGATVVTPAPYQPSVLLTTWQALPSLLSISTIDPLCEKP